VVVKVQIVYARTQFVCSRNRTILLDGFVIQPRGFGERWAFVPFPAAVQDPAQRRARPREAKGGEGWKRRTVRRFLRPLLVTARSPVSGG
jgi:hypothetical protein